MNKIVVESYTFFVIYLATIFGSKIKQIENLNGTHRQVLNNKHNKNMNIQTTTKNDNESIQQFF